MRYQLKIDINTISRLQKNCYTVINITSKPTFVKICWQIGFVILQEIQFC